MSQAILQELTRLSKAIEALAERVSTLEAAKPLSLKPKSGQ